MKRKSRYALSGEDSRAVAIYTRKSRITNKGDSIGVQFKQSADYARNQLSLAEDYSFLRYEDKGLSGYYSDRPDFQRLLRDIEMGKIRAVACYKLDRISRKTSDLMRLLEYFERHDVTLLVCSNNINTQISTSKIIIQVLAIIAEFERDILTERIQDNLMELAKDGRWLGGATPTGFSSKRVSTGSGKNKSAVSFLVSIDGEKALVQKIYRTFMRTRSLMATSKEIGKEHRTKLGAEFTPSTIRLILKNPIYCTADERAYNYFLEHDGNIFGDLSEFDGTHGISAYNKTDQCKIEDEESTFFNPKFSQLLSPKPISEWIISVGRHEGFISSKDWIETQLLLEAIAEKYNRPHRKTNALLAGLMYCPICGKRLRVISESDRWTNGKPRFKYVCPGVRKQECTFKAVEGVTLDEYVVQQLSELSQEQSEYYKKVFEAKLDRLVRSSQSEQEYQAAREAVAKLETAIAAQVRNMREAHESLRKYIEADIQEMSAELERRQAELHRMEELQAGNQFAMQELNVIKKRLLSFAEYAKDAEPEALVTLINTVVERIYITTEGDKRICQIFIKGCATEDYSRLFGAAGYIEQNAVRPLVGIAEACDSDGYCIAAHIDPVHHQTGLHGDLAVSRTAENGRSRVVQRQEGKGQGGNAEVSQTGLHHIGGNRPEEEPEQTTRQDQTGSHDAQTEHGGQEHQLPCALPSLLLPPRPQKLAGNHGAAGGQGGKQVQNDVVDHVHQGHTGYGGLSHSGDHHPVAHAHQGRQGLLHHQRKNQPDQRPV